MQKESQQWLRQANYDMESADVMFQAGRHFYAIFMCHLSIEKALKGVFQKNFDQLPPKTHNLLFFVDKLKLNLPENLSGFIATLSRVSVPTRYPDDLDELLSEFPKKKVMEMLLLGKETLAWIKANFFQS